MKDRRYIVYTGESPGEKGRSAAFLWEKLSLLEPGAAGAAASSRP